MDSSRQYIPLFYNWVKEDIETRYRGIYDISIILDELYNLQPILFLDTFVESVEHYSNVLSALKDGYHEGPLSKTDIDDLIL